VCKVQIEGRDSFARVDQEEAELRLLQRCDRWLLHFLLDSLSDNASFVEKVDASRIDESDRNIEIWSDEFLSIAGQPGGRIGDRCFSLSQSIEERGLSHVWSAQQDNSEYIIALVKSSESATSPY